MKNAVLAVAVGQIARHDQGGHGAQPGDDRVRFVEPTQMGIARRERAILGGEARMVLNSQEQFCCRFVKSAFEEIGHTNCGKRYPRAVVRAQAERDFKMFDREIGLAGPEPQNAAQRPTAGIAWVECECAVNQPHHGDDILAETRKYEGGVGEDAWVVLLHLERQPGKIAGLSTMSPAFRPNLQ